MADIPFNHEEIIKLLPHRFPFLLVDRIVAYDPGERIVGLKNVTFNEPFFPGHFPGRPVMPGVLIIEAMAQVGGVMAYDQASQQNKDILIYIMSMDKVKFRKPVIPGDQLLLELTSQHHSARAWRMTGRALVDDNVVTEAELTASVVPTMS
ncbi:MAG: 3-hydroxyacyl-ACP dehydratase FabZ [Desulfarculaceae bacterium]|jgi:beta-hydroxyacyl-ACP dehydratase FabZ